MNDFIPIINKAHGKAIVKETAVIPNIRKGHGEMRFLRHRNAEQMQPACGW